MYGIKMGCKSIMVSGAFGDRQDHNFATLSIAEKILNANQ
jgi:thiamine pyrophosphokinase